MNLALAMVAIAFRPVASASRVVRQVIGAWHEERHPDSATVQIEQIIQSRAAKRESSPKSEDT